MTATPLPPVRFLDRASPPHVATLILMTGLSALATSVFLPSLGHMSEAFGVPYATMQLAVSGFLAANAALQLVVGPLADRFGRRPVMLGGLLVFVLASVGALVATDVRLFLLCRLLQAASAAGVVLSRAVIRDMVAPERAASMIGYVTMGMAVIPMVGPLLGGVLDEAFGWRASFALLLAAGLLVTGLVLADLGETGRTDARGFGAQVRDYPALLGSRTFWGFALCAAFASGAYFALLGGAAYVSGTIFGLTPAQTGLALASPTIGYTLGNFLSGRHAARVGIMRMAASGCAVATLGLGAGLLVTLSGAASPWLFFGACTALGLGNGLTLPSALAGSISVRPDLAGTAAGLSGAVMTGGGALLSILAGVALQGHASPWPLQALMAGSSGAALLSLLLVRR